MRFAAEIGTSLALLFAGVIASVHVDHPLLEKLLDRLLDLNLVCPRRDTENIFVLLFAQKRSLLSQLDGLDQIVRLVHRVVLSANCSSALSVTMILSNASNCSVFTSVAVASKTGFTLRAER